MKNHYDTALLGIWWGANYGSCLNGYAVHRILKSLGKSVLLVMKHNASENDWELTNTHNARFIKQFYPEDDVSPVIPFNRLHELNDMVDTFITGSDQVWNYEVNGLFDMAFLQNFVDDNKRQISFATSFGHDTDKTPPELLPESIRLMRRFNAISVREKAGVEICRSVYGVNASVVVEPVFCLEKKDYLELAEHSKIDEKGPYILTYILDPTEEKKKTIEYYCKASGMRAVNVLDGNHLNHERNKKALGLPGIIDDLGAHDLLKLIANSEFVISDSFHGAAFAIIFNKPFLSVANNHRGAARFVELLSRFGLIDRLVPSNKIIPKDPKFFKKIDYTQINEIIKRERESSIEWLKKALDTPLDQLPAVCMSDKAVTSGLDKDMCMGCGACVSVCPKKALELRPDHTGFYRAEISYSKCINCGECANVCPALKLPESIGEQPEECLGVIAANEKMLENSMGGGAFAVLADKMLRNGGAVFGAAWNDEYTAVSHIAVTDRNEVHKLYKPKYLQSDLGDTFRKVKEKLDDNIPVLFSGCPCHAAGLRSYLGKEYDKLIIVDYICPHTPPAPLFKKYLDEQFPKGVRSYEFGYRRLDGSKDDRFVRIVDPDGRESIRNGASDDPYIKAYKEHLMTGTHCDKCIYQKDHRYGDITLAAFGNIHKKDRSIDDTKGVSAVICGSRKGEAFVSDIDSNAFRLKKKVPVSWLWEDGPDSLGSLTYAGIGKNIFFDCVKKMPFTEALRIALNQDNAHNENINPMQFSSSQTHFEFDGNIWEEHIIRGKLMLTVTADTIRPGRYAYLPLYRPLKKGRRYEFFIRFKVKTDSEYVNFHIIDRKTKRYKIIHTHKPYSDSSNWITVTKEFTADSDIYNSFMIGASQIIGEDNFFILDSINIIEKK